MVVIEVWCDHERIGLVEVASEKVPEALRRFNHGPCTAHVATMTTFGDMVALVAERHRREQELVKHGFPKISDTLFTRSNSPLMFDLLTK